MANMKPKEEFYKYGESLGIKINDLQRLKMLANNYKAEKILREYINFEDVNQSESIELMPLTIVDAMEEYATQYKKDITKLLEFEINKAFIHGQRNALNIDAGLERDEVKEYTNSRMIILNKQN